MSDTPKTDELAKREFITDGVWIRHARKLERENAELRNEIARLNNQTNWVCKCGGTDCEGQKENAALREDKERLDWLEQLYEWPTHHDGEWHCFAGTFKTFRDAIDAERKGAQP